MTRIAICALLISLGVATASEAQVTACNPGAAELKATLTAPAGFASVTIGLPDGSSQASTLTGANGQVSLDPGTLLIWTATANATPAAVLIWKAADGRACAQSISASGATPSAIAPPTEGEGAPASGNCTNDGEKWRQELQGLNKNQRPTVIVFNGPNACYRSDSTKPATHGDPIYIGVLSQTPSEWAAAAIDFTPCDIESATPLIQPGDQFPASFRQAGNWRLMKFLPRSCWNDSVAISVTAVGSKAKAGMILQQYPRYRATMHLGAISTELHETEFGLRADGGVTRIYSKGPSGNGPEYTASLVFYGVLKYIPHLFGKPAYKGREIRNEQGLFDRIGFSTGVGIKNPFERFVVGGTFEIISGVNLFAGWDFFETPLLAGVNENQVFEGSEEQIPVTKEWRHQTSVGITFDLAYAAKLFK